VGVVHRLGVQALDGAKHQNIVSAPEIERTDHDHHIGADDPDDLVKPPLIGRGLRHDIPQASEHPSAPNPC